MRENSVNKKVFLFLIIILTLSLLLTACEFEDGLDFALDILEIFVNTDSKTSLEDYSDLEGFKVHFIDVGQGDSIFIQTHLGETLLIDAGDNDKGDVVVDYLKSQKVKKIDYIIGTHPHADHIGGIDDVIYAFDVATIYMPKVEHTTKTYRDVLEAIRKRNVNLKAAKAGDTIPLEGISAEILSPDGDLDTENLNDFSIVVRLVYENTAFIFQGDAERQSEEYILKEGYDIRSNLIKLGHHGSFTSSIPEYIEAVDPDYAVITLAADNPYGHPHREIMALMKERDIKVYRTDEDGNILAVSDGEEISFILNNK